VTFRGNLDRRNYGHCRTPAAFPPRHHAVSAVLDFVQPVGGRPAGLLAGDGSLGSMEPAVRRARCNMMLGSL